MKAVNLQYQVDVYNTIEMQYDRSFLYGTLMICPEYMVLLWLELFGVVKRIV